MYSTQITPFFGAGMPEIIVAPKPKVDELDAGTTEHLLQLGRYRDEGCEFAPKCLDCPFPSCRFDEHPRAFKAMVLRRKVAAFARERILAGAAVDNQAVMAEFAVSKRTAARWLSGVYA